MNIVYRAAELLITSAGCNYDVMATNLSLLMLNKQVSQEEYSKLCALMDEQKNKVSEATQA